MSDLIVIRLHPNKPTPGGDFTNFLTGLTITAYDLSTGNPKPGIPVGSASYVGPPDPGQPWLPDPATRIVQHFTVVVAPLLPVPEAVATAVIEVALPAGYHDYVSPDLRIEISRGGTTIVDKLLYYDVVTTSVGALPLPDFFPSFAPSLYLELPRPVGVGLAALDLGDEGAPPSFEPLKLAVTSVLAADQGPVPALDAISPAQARHIAYEIVWGPQAPLPAPPASGAPGYDDLGALYSSEVNDGSLVSPKEQQRQQFEGNLSSYYAIRNATVDRLARFIFALSAAIACEAMSDQANAALLQFPPYPGGPGTQTTIDSAEVLLVGIGGAPLAPAFHVPAEYFYALGLNLPAQVDADRRFQMACRDIQERLLPILVAAMDDGTISNALVVNPAQAVRRLTALTPQSNTSAPHRELDAAIQPLVTDWLAFPPAATWPDYRPGDDAANFWVGELGAKPMPYLQLVLGALTDSHQPLIDAVILFPIATVAALASMTEAQWKALFGKPPQHNLLPPFTAPGTDVAREAAFIRHVQKFFDMTSGLPALAAATAAAVPVLDPPTVDAIGLFVAAYGGALTFGSAPLDGVKLDAAALAVFPGDPAAQSWLKQRARVINDLCILAGVVSKAVPPKPSLSFLVVEALYARGFTGADDIKRLSADDFADALRGTVAFAQAGTIWTAAGGMAPPPAPAPGPFRPVNPGSLINCIPPCYLSPLGPVEYLHELLELSEASTCQDPSAPPPPGHDTLGGAIAKRRGPLGNLAVTAANAETQLPVIDIVNENLEHLAAILPAPPVGVVYDTGTDTLGGHVLCADGAKPKDCHEPNALFEALPEHSSPAVPVGASPAYDKLKLDFSAPSLPYSQPLDLGRSYLEHFATCRFETMRVFRKEITEFTLDPSLAAPTFQSHLWRYPVRIDTAIEYLQINPEEYDLLFSKDIADVPTPGHLVLYELYGFDTPKPGGIDWFNIVMLLPEFLKRTGLSYCELVELQKSGCFQFAVLPRGDREQQPALPDCEPCCLEHYRIVFIKPANQIEALRQLVVYLRLWRKLKEVCGARYNFPTLCDICEVLQLFIGNSINPEFIRQLAGFQILKDQFGLKLTDGSHVPGSHGASRTHILALWVGPGATKWIWAVGRLVDRIAHFAKARHESRGRAPDFIKLLVGNLDPLSILAGFDPQNATDTWHARPTNTLRFAEVLGKIYASKFSIGEILYLFTAQDHLDGDDPFALQDSNEALDLPLGLPDGEHAHALWALRRKLLAVEVSEEELHDWSWHRIETALREEFGYDVPPGGTDYLTSLGQHFFPEVLEHSGTPVAAKDRQYRVDLPAGTPGMWNTPPDGPFRFDGGAPKQLWTQIPLRDEAVINKLEHLRKLTPPEQTAVQNLYYMPRVDLAPFACLFPSLDAAERHLIEERSEQERWAWFRRHFALAYKRCHVIASHLVGHVAAATESEWEGGHKAAWLILQRLFADENRAKTTWEADSGAMPDVTWKPLPSGGSFAALLGLTGTGLLGEFRRANDVACWQEMQGPMSAFGHERSQRNAPVPTILPAMDLTLAPEQSKYVELRNGFAIRDRHGRDLGGAESFQVTWSGLLLVDDEGKYEFTAGAPTADGEAPDRERAEHCRWRVTLTRGQRTWVLLRHHWQGGEHGPLESSLALRRGAYGITVEFVQPPPNFTGVDDIHPQHTGFQVKYCGPDTGGRQEALPLHRLFRDLKDDPPGIEFPEGSTAGLVLALQYTSTIRDIRRTYQRAFKALLFAHRFALSGHLVQHYRRAELGYMLDHADLFAGVSYFRNPAFTHHAANFDFNFLPLKDQYRPPLPAQDQRVDPTPKRRQALFDWWERIYDYTHMRGDRTRAPERPVWLLFEEAEEKQPDNPAQLLRHLDIDFRHAPLVLSYFDKQALPVYAVTSDDLKDDRWAVRAWHGDRWTSRLVRHFRPLDIRKARPDLWASDDPGSLVAAETETSNANLSRFLCDGCFENGEPRRYTDVKVLADRLRERARAALLAYLCGMNRVALPWGGTAKCAKDLSELLLLDVEAGLCERRSRIEDAGTAVHDYILRARLGLEPGWSVSAPFVQLWTREFALFAIWEKCKCRTLYKENWIEWDELLKARKIEAYQFLETELRRSTLTIAVPGGLEYWPQSLPPVHPAVKLLQERQPSALRLLNPPREGLGVLGVPERDARPSWLAPDFGQATTQVTFPPGDVSPNPSGAGAGGHGRAAPIPGGRPAQQPLPFWIEAAIRLGAKFIRVAAAGVPPAAAEFHASDFHAEPGCCDECGCVHPPLVDEYYFWLIGAQVFNAPDPDQDEYYDPTQQASTEWHNPDSLPTLLDWTSMPAARLAWCRVHNGELMQPRRSDECVQLAQGTVPDLVLVGRLGDSLTFSVAGGIHPVGYKGSDQPGFRYDLATDSAVTLPLVVVDGPGTVSPYPAGLPVYPYFAFVEPGDRLFLETPFSPAIAVAGVLRCHCRFEPALKWYRLVRDPLQVDNIWVDCGGQLGTGDVAPIDPGSVGDIAPLDLGHDTRPGDGNDVLPPPSRGQIIPPVPIVPQIDMCCDSTKISAQDARDRAILLHYLETLLEWSRALMRRNSRESAQQARVVLDTAARILGPCPRTVVNHQPPKLTTTVMTVAGFVPLNPPLNPRLTNLYCHVGDGLALVHRCLTDARLRATSGDCRTPYWGKDPCDCGPFEQHCGCDSGEEPCCDDDTWCRPHSPYRFAYLVQKAQEAASRVCELGNALTSAFERGDAEYLASMRTRHEVEIADLNIRVRQDQWRDADWQVKALGKTKEVTQSNRRYYKHLIDAGLNNGELNYESNMITAAGLQTTATGIEAVAEAMEIIPDLFVGFPCEETWLPLGSKLANMFKTIARITNELAGIASTNASLDQTEGSWQRRLDEWVHQVETLDIEIEQIEIQILGAERRRNQALQELNIQQRGLEQAREVLDATRDKFTNHALYLHLQKHLAGMFFQMHGVASQLALEAQRAFNFELGYTRRNFLPCDGWDELHEGLLSGEKLQLALQRMEAEYATCNRREYELTKHISLAQHFPMQFLRLKLTGRCEIAIPEWMFDLDYPGHYMRRIKTVSLTIPCVTGPYTGVHCRLTLLSSHTRIDPCLPCPVAQCCDDRPRHACGCRHEPGEHYDAGCGDQRMAVLYGAREAIATSSGRNDAGLFEMNFHDERHLPFEFSGAVSCWRIEMPPENNYFEMDSLADVAMQMSYTSREGGDALRDAARASARSKLPGNCWIMIDVRKDFPDAWELFRRTRREHEGERSMTLRVDRKLFPFLPGDPGLKITKLGILLEAEERHPHKCPELHECACASEDVRGSHLVEVTVDHADDDRDDFDEVEIECVSSADWPKLYHGVGEIEVAPIDRWHEQHSLVLTFADDVRPRRMFLLCRYEVIEQCCETMRCTTPTPQLMTA